MSAERIERAKKDLLLKWKTGAEHAKIHGLTPPALPRYSHDATDMTTEDIDCVLTWFRKEQAAAIDLAERCEDQDKIYILVWPKI